MIWWIEQIEWFWYTKSDGYPLKLPKFAILGWAGIFWHRLSTNQIVRCFKLKKRKSNMRYQADFLLPLKLHKICYFGLCRKILLANQFAGFFTFDLFDMLMLILGIHCYIVFVVIVVIIIIIIIIVLYLTSVKIYVNDKTNCKSHSSQLGLYTPN